MRATRFPERQLDAYRVLHPMAWSAQRRAKYLHERGRRVAKGVLWFADDGPVLALLPAPARVNLLALAELTSARRLRLATPAEVCRTFPDCEPGHVPGHGRAYRVMTAMDASLLEEPYVLLPGANRIADYRIAPAALLQLEEPLIGRFATWAGRRRAPLSYSSAIGIR